MSRTPSYLSKTNLNLSDWEAYKSLKKGEWLLENQLYTIFLEKRHYRLEKLVKLGLVETKLVGPETFYFVKPYTLEMTEK
jgi:hypothetical protein